MISSTSIKLRDLANLAGARNELLLQSHLFKAELKDLWLVDEARWRDIQSAACAARASMKNSRVELGLTASLAAKALRESYEDFQRALRTI